MNANKPERQVSPEDRKEAEELIRLLRESLPEEEFNRLAEEILHPELRAEREAHEARAERVQAFVNGLHEVPAGYDLSEGFEARWEELLGIYEAQAKESFAKSQRTPEQIGRLVKRGWMTVDLAASELKHHLKQPPPDTHPIPVVLANHNGHWNAPAALLEFGVKRHPFVRAVTDQLPQRSAKERVLRKLKWAEKEGTSGEYHATLLAQAADSLDLVMYAEMFGEAKEIGWLYRAKKSERFWRILDAAIGFGRRLATHEIYGDGTVEELIQKSLVNPGGKSPDDWRTRIDELLPLYFKQTGKKPTSKRLLSWLGGVRGSNDAGKMTFKKKIGAGLNGISWDQFVNRVEASQKRSRF
jgi:hypothetical protein